MVGTVSLQRRIARRRIVVLAVSVIVPLVLVTAFDHRGVHMTRSLLVPGAGLFDVRLWLGLSFVIAAIAATIGWLRWGTDGVLAAVVVASVVVSGLMGTGSHHDATDAAGAVRWAAHEFPLVVLVVGALAWAAGVVRGLPGVRSVVHRRAAQRRGLDDVAHLGSVDRCRTAVVAVLSGADQLHWRAVVDHADVATRVRRIDRVSRLRRSSFPPLVDHAAVRAACILTGAATTVEQAAEASRRPLGVPAAEPTWVRLLDATLFAAALDHAGEPAAGIAWLRALAHEFSMHRGHRPAWYWTPLGVAATSAPAWEHAAASAIARWRGWIGDDDWSALRRRVLGAAARGSGDPHDERLIAAARVWLVFVDDPEARRIVARPTVQSDPLACALDQLATRLAPPG